MIDYWGSLASDEDVVQFDAVDVARMDEHGLLSTLAAAQRIKNRLDAVQAMAMARFSALRGDVPGVADEVGYELGMTRHAADTRIGHAKLLVERHPVVLEAMYNGELGGYAAGRIAGVTAPLSDEDARRVDERLAGRMAGKDPTELRRLARKLVAQVDPDGQADRAKRARDRRNVQLIPGEDTMSTLVADLPAEVASAAYASIDAEARRLRRNGEERNLDQLRADILGQRLIGGDGASAGVRVMLHMPIDAALSITDDGCELDGYGPIPGPIARQIMTDPKSIWRKVICDPATGAVLDLGRSRYKPNQAIRDVVAVRDRECSVPACYRPAMECDYDHLISAARWGDTSVANGNPQCEYHNNLKERPNWQIDIDRKANTVTITTPTGRSYTRQRRTILKPQPPARQSHESRTSTRTASNGTRAECDGLRRSTRFGRP